VASTEASRVAEIVGGFGVPHTPHFYSWANTGHPLADEIVRMYDGVGKRLRDAAPDTIVVFTSDHYNIFFEESLPIFSIGVAESARGPSDYDTIPEREVRIDSALAREVQRHLVHSEFDVGASQEFAFDHTVIGPLSFLLPDPGNDIAVVPVFISAFMRPIASSSRCYALGRAIRDAIERYHGPQRVAALASGGFSFEVGGPRIAGDSHVGVPDPGWVDRVAELLRAGDVDMLVSEATDERFERAGNAAGETLDWIAMLGLIDPAPAAYLEVQPQFGHAYAAWPAA
jgi:protocatechuate 4,5-dioxygenase beta chain